MNLITKNTALAVAAATLLLTLSLSMGCGSAAQGQLSGDVFIVTQGAENVKLGLVEVCVLPYAETQASIAKTKAQAERELAILQPQLDAARKGLANAQARENAANREVKAASERGTEAVRTDNFDALEQSNQSEESALNRWGTTIGALNSAKGVVTALEKKARSWNSGALYFASLPPAVASAKTDADGKFSIHMNRKGTFVLAASATRRVFKDTESYYWLVGVSLDGQPDKRIFLSNDNLATSDSKDSLVHVAE